eukprot:scaffold537_cov180-Ochromonas_danica.AAC.42
MDLPNKRNRLFWYGAAAGHAQRTAHSAQWHTQSERVQRGWRLLWARSNQLTDQSATILLPPPPYPISPLASALRFLLSIGSC